MFSSSATHDQLTRDAERPSCSAQRVASIGWDPQWSANASLCTWRTASNSFRLSGTSRIPGGGGKSGGDPSKVSVMSANQRTASSPACSYSARTSVSLVSTAQITFSGPYPGRDVWSCHTAALASCHSSRAWPMP